MLKDYCSFQSNLEVIDLAELKSDYVEECFVSFFWRKSLEMFPNI